MADDEFTIVREFAAPRELVFKAWTDPDQVARWWGPHNFTTPRSSIDMDVRVGGRYRGTMVSDEDGSKYPMVGEYLEVVEPERLVFTWADPNDGNVERASTITLTFEATGDKTTMTFHLRAPGPLSATDGAEDGWSESLDRLADFVAISA